MHMKEEAYGQGEPIIQYMKICVKEEHEIMQRGTITDKDKTKITWEYFLAQHLLRTLCK